MLYMIIIHGPAPVHLSIVRFLISDRVNHTPPVWKDYKQTQRTEGQEEKRALAQSRTSVFLPYNITIRTHSYTFEQESFTRFPTKITMTTVREVK